MANAADGAHSGRSDALAGVTEQAALDAEARAWLCTRLVVVEPVLRRYARRFERGGRLEIDDLISETFARIMSNGQWRTIDNVAGYATQVLHNLAIDQIRQGKVISIDALAEYQQAGLNDGSPSPEDIALDRDELRHLQAIVEELPPQCRKVFTLCKVYGLRHDEIAEQLNISVSTVEKHIVRALQLCGARLARDTSGRDRSRRTRSWMRLVKP